MQKKKRREEFEKTNKSTELFLLSASHLASSAHPSLLPSSPFFPFHLLHVPTNGLIAGLSGGGVGEKSARKTSGPWHQIGSLPPPLP